MLNCPRWIISAIQKRFDEIDQALEEDLQIQRVKHEAKHHLDSLKKILNAEQLEVLKKWDDQMNYCSAMEKESLYLRGFIDGIHLSASTFDSNMINYNCGNTKEDVQE